MDSLGSYAMSGNGERKRLLLGVVTGVQQVGWSSGRDQGRIRGGTMGAERAHRYQDRPTDEDQSSLRGMTPNFCRYRPSRSRRSRETPTETISCVNVQARDGNAVSSSTLSAADGPLAPRPRGAPRGRPRVPRSPPRSPPRPRPPRAGRSKRASISMKTFSSFLALVFGAAALD